MSSRNGGSTVSSGRQQLGGDLREHIRIEDEVVFPAAKRRLSSPQQSAIANEMASRRNLSS
jgi:hemerythrin-like domain-containing protein